MKILITAGGTKEPIDRVRSITNTSTGQLAARIHDAWLDTADSTGMDLTMYYVAGPGAAMPNADERVTNISVTDTASVQTAIHQILTDHEIDVVIHLMAISDFYVSAVRSLSQEAKLVYEYVHSLEEAGEELTLGGLKDLLASTSDDTNRDEGKISSSEALCLHLAKTPKIITEMKSISPGSRLIGFKLLDSVSEENLVEVAEAQRVKNGCDFVVANDLANIDGERHEAVFVRDGKVFRRCSTKEDIAKAIVEELTK